MSISGTIKEPRVMPGMILAVITVGLAVAVLSGAGGSAAPIPHQYRVAPPRVPAEDLSGEVGRRLLNLLSVRAAKHLDWVRQECRTTDGSGGDLILPTPDRPADGLDYTLYRAAAGIYAWAILARFGEPEKTVPGVTRAELERLAVALIRAVAQTHPANRSPRAQPAWWNKHWALRIDYIYGMGAWLLWDRLDPETRCQVARVLEHDADLYNHEPAPAKLYEDTQAESNAWTSSGLALAYCMLKDHPHRAIWGERAKEWMISAYATQRDVDSDRLVDGRPLKQWLNAPNLFPDYTLENHGLVHPVYLAAVSEMVQTAVAYRLADEIVPEAVTFNADKVLDLLLIMNLPDGNHLYVQGTDYCSRNLSSFFQAGNVEPLKPTPLRTAGFLRSLSSLEKMAAERPELPMEGWLGWADEFGTTWGLTGNYMMRRLFGSPDEALPEDQIETRLAGVHVFDSGRFIIHRTPTSLSSFSWHTSGKASQIMGLTIPLKKDVLCYPMPGSLIGGLREAGTTGAADAGPSLKLLSHKLDSRRDGFSLMMELERGEGKVRQNCAFVSLPDGRSVYFEERLAVRDIAIASAGSGNVVIYDDTRWVYQPKPREFFGDGGRLEPQAATALPTSWVNIDDSLGIISLGAAAARLSRRAGQPGIWRRPDETMYDTCRLEFMTVPENTDAAARPLAFAAGRRISAFALISCPNQRREDTAALANVTGTNGWLADRDGLLAIRIGKCVAYANFSASPQIVLTDDPPIPAAPKSSGWLPVAELP